ncbi:hypothetical protein WJX73_004922 [Symbiochloris irregularis]|uniref:Chlorophyllase n=1 Tax=Symbiochloris irregularis TaxID=706552 RepID=A0AAW1PC47_9CHLO
MAESSPFSWKVLRLVFPIPESTESAGIQNLPLTVTIPEAPSTGAVESAPDPQTEASPVILFFSGFKLKAAYYSKYAQGLAAQGYAVVQYDTPFLKLPNDATEVAWLPGLLSWLQAQTQDDSSPLHRRLDLARIGTAGHSRGGKLAALHIAGNSQISAAYLIDPVDNTSQTPESAEYPSACKALQGIDKPAAITGAGIGGPCNPEGSNSPVFFGAVNPGSWYMTVLGAGHASFFKAPWLIQKAADFLCHRGKESHEATVSLAIAPMLAWFGRHLKRSGDERQAQDKFFEWIKREEQAGRVSFQDVTGAKSLNANFLSRQGLNSMPYAPPGR